MYTITILRSSLKSQISLKICWTQKGPNLDQKGSKMGVARFFPDFKPQFFKEDNNIGFYTKNQQNLTSHLDELLFTMTYVTRHQQSW